MTVLKENIDDPSLPRVWLDEDTDTGAVIGFAREEPTPPREALRQLCIPRLVHMLIAVRARACARACVWLVSTFCVGAHACVHV